MNISPKIKSIFSFIDNKILYLLVISVFLPFYFTAAVVLGVCIYIFCKNKILSLFEKRGIILLTFFVIYTIIIALLNSNYIGAACSVMFFAIIIVSMYARRYFNLHSFERALSISCFCGG